jgi:hypothetical protein
MDFASKMTANLVCIWFAFWAIRSRYEVDEKLDGKAHIVRWSIIVGSYAALLLPGPEFKIIRIVALTILLAFLCWPNFAYRLRHWLWRDNTAESKF